MEILYVILLIIGLSALAGWSMWNLQKSAIKIHDEIRRVKQLSEDAETREQLDHAWGEAFKVNKEAWHKSFTAGIVEIKTILTMKYKALDKAK